MNAFTKKSCIGFYYVSKKVQTQEMLKLELSDRYIENENIWKGCLSIIGARFDTLMDDKNVCLYCTKLAFSVTF